MRGDALLAVILTSKLESQSGMWRLGSLEMDFRIMKGEKAFKRMDFSLFRNLIGWIHLIWSWREEWSRTAGSHPQQSLPRSLRMVHPGVQGKLQRWQEDLHRWATRFWLNSSTKRKHTRGGSKDRWPRRNRATVQVCEESQIYLELNLVMDTKGDKKCSHKRKCGPTAEQVWDLVKKNTVQPQKAL